VNHVHPRRQHHFTISADRQHPARRDLASGARAKAPIVISFPPCGLPLGTAMAWSGTGLIYGAGSLTLIKMLRSWSGLWAAVGAAVLINSRLLVCGSSSMPLWRSARLPIRLLAATVISTGHGWGESARRTRPLNHPSAGALRTRCSRSHRRLVRARHGRDVPPSVRGHRCASRRSWCPSTSAGRLCRDPRGRRRCSIRSSLPSLVRPHPDGNDNLGRRAASTTWCP
jgi:hypothetical protein